MFIKFSVVGEVVHASYNNITNMMFLSVKVLENVKGGKVYTNTMTNMKCSLEVAMHMSRKLRNGQLIYAEGKLRSMSETKGGNKKKESVEFYVKEIIIIKHERDNPYARKDDRDFGIREDEEYDTYEGEPLK